VVASSGAVALLTALLAFVGRQLSTLIQAILGWSVTALFGRLSSIKQTALGVALLIAILWVVAVIGVFLPAVSAWAFAFLPLHRWLGDAVVRWATFGLVVVLPLIVGGITRWVGREQRRSASLWGALASSYGLTLGYAAACIITAVTVPIVKIMSAIRRWHDEHVYVQPREGQYTRALDELLRACDAAGVSVRVETVPRSMRLASSVLKALARGAVDPVLAKDPKMLRGQGIELYLYPADLLLRGKTGLVAHVRAAMTRTMLEGFAFTVWDPKAQAIQSELQRLWQAMTSESVEGRDLTEMRTIAHRLDTEPVPFDQWLTLDRSLRRLERHAIGCPSLLENDAPTSKPAAARADRSAPNSSATTRPSGSRAPQRA
jgi:hypothetical protein